MSPKEIAEKTIETLVPEAPIYMLAHAYLELEKEITKLKKSREVLRKACEFYADKDSWLGFEEEQGFCWSNEFCPKGQDYENTEGTCMVAGKKAREALKADDEIINGMLK